jgi:hypothetical protein
MKNPVSKTAEHFPKIAVHAVAMLTGLYQRVIVWLPEMLRLAQEAPAILKYFALPSKVAPLLNLPALKVTLPVLVKS